MQFVGIFGTGRNGSTLLMRVLDGIPGAFIDPAEVNLLSILNDLAEGRHARERTIKNATSRPLRSLHRPIPTERLISYYKGHVQEIQTESLSRIDPPIQVGPAPLETISERSQYSAVEFVPAFLEALSGWVSPEQTPECAMFKSIETPYIEDYEEAFPTMRFIHIIRDPIDVWSSSKRSLMRNKAKPSWYMGLDVLKTVIGYRWMPHARAILARQKSSRHTYVRYEDLIQTPEKVVCELADWIGFGQPSKPKTQTILGGRAMTSIALNPSQKGVETPIDVQSDLAERNNYVEVLTEREHDFIRLHTYELASQLGYEDAPTAEPGELLRRWLVSDIWDFMHVRGVKSWVLALTSFVYRRAFVFQACRLARNSKQVEKK